LLEALPKEHDVGSFSRAVALLSKKSGFSVKTQVEKNNAFSICFQGASIEDSVSLSLLFDSLFSKPISE